ncbi:response regulator transcription factor [Brochothrix thermosphacta]|uniref:response regulator transcription factor n=1 Tax=Brochothrix thermosphacta TaxID=2756 RepID=UPI000D7B7E84|nr:response regulator transcription factor [Brochothrix thermosphacta]SPN75659.1 putative two component transcriptional regulator, AraC family, YesN [Brochothrix thermosphacta]
MYKLLLVDDEYMILNGLKKIINWENMGIEISGTAKNGQEALDFIREHPVDIVITDVTMPAMSGIEFVQQAQNDGYRFYFIIMSGYQEFSYVKEGLVLGAENYLVKPVDKSELLKNVESIVEKISMIETSISVQPQQFQTLIQEWLHLPNVTENFVTEMATYGYTIENERYTALIFKGLEKHHGFLMDLVKKNKQPYFFFQEDIFMIVFRGLKYELRDFLRQLRELLKEADFKLGLGKTEVPYTEVAHSYEQAQQVLTLCSFYELSGVQQLKRLLASLDESEVPQEISLDKLHHALTLGKMTTIEAEVQAIFTLMYEQEMTPSYVTHISFLILADIYRRFNQADQVAYQEALLEISKIKTFQKLQKIIETSIKQVEREIDVKQFSPNIQHVLQIIMERYRTDLTLKEVAEQLHLNAMYLGQLFKKETKKSFSQYLNHYRITKAKDLLLHSDYNINEISEKIGYTSTGYFYKNFKNVSGISPRDYRQQFGNEE